MNCCWCFLQAFHQSSALQVRARGAQTVQEARTAGTPASTADGRDTSSPDRPASSSRGSESTSDASTKSRLNERATQSRAAELFMGRSSAQQPGLNSSKVPSESGESDAGSAEAAAAERRRSTAEAGSSQAQSGQPGSSQSAGPGRTVRLIKGPGGRLIRAPVAAGSDDEDEDPLPPSRAARTENPGERLLCMLSEHVTIVGCSTLMHCAAESPPASCSVCPCTTSGDCSPFIQSA